MSRFFLLPLALAIATSVLGQTTERWGFNNVPDHSVVNQMSGPRFGFTYISDGSTAQYLNRVHELSAEEYAEAGELPFTWTTQYGWQWESRFADTGGPVVGLVEWVALIGGMEKGMFLPSFSSLVGIRSKGGMEFATGPSVSATGLGFIFAMGYNYQKGDLNLPINIALVPDKQGSEISNFSQIMGASDDFQDFRLRNTGYRVTLSVGFNLLKAES